MKNCIVFFVLFVVSLSSSSQSPYLLLDHDEVYDLLNIRKIDIMDNDSNKIHSVDGTNYRNLIFYFSDGLCTKVITTFQTSMDFFKVVDFLDKNFQTDESMTWIIPMGEGFDEIKGYRRKGYDVIEENYSVE